MGIAVLSAALLVNMRVAVHMRIVYMIVVYVRVVMCGIVLHGVILVDHGVCVVGLIGRRLNTAVHRSVCIVAMAGKGVR